MTRSIGTSPITIRDNYNSLSSDICQADWAVWQPKSNLLYQNVDTLHTDTVFNAKKSPLSN